MILQYIIVYYVGALRGERLLRQEGDGHRPLDALVDDEGQVLRGENNHP